MQPLSYLLSHTLLSSKLCHCCPLLIWQPISYRSTCTIPVGKSKHLVNVSEGKEKNERRVKVIRPLFADSERVYSNSQNGDCWWAIERGQHSSFGLIEMNQGFSINSPSLTSSLIHKATKPLKAIATKMPEFSLPLITIFVLSLWCFECNQCHCSTL